MFVCGRLSWSLSGHPRPSLSKHRCTVGVLAGTHRCATESRVTLWQSANPCFVCCWSRNVVCVPSARVRTPRSCATENTYISARLEALFKLSIVTIVSHSYPFKKLSAGCGCSFQLVILLKISTKCVLASLSAVSQSILVHVNADPFLLSSIDQCRMLSRLSLDFTAIVATTCLPSSAWL